MPEEKWRKRLTFQPSPGASIMDAFKIAEDLPQLTTGKLPLGETEREIKSKEWYGATRPEEYEERERIKREAMVREGVRRNPKLPEPEMVGGKEGIEIFSPAKSSLTYGSQPQIREAEDVLSRKEKLRARAQVLSEKVEAESLRRREFEEWRSSPKGAPLRFAETVGARFLNPRELRRIPAIPKMPFGGYKKYGRGIERRKAKLLFSR